MPKRVIDTSLFFTAFIVAALGLAACEGGTGKALPGAMPSYQAAHRDVAAGNGVAAPIASPTSLSFTALGTDNVKTFVVNVQFAGDLTAVSSDTSVATVDPPSATPLVTPADGGSKSATFTVTPVGNGTCTITVTDKKGRSVTIAISVSTAPLVFVAPSAAPYVLGFDGATNGNATPLRDISSATIPLTHVSAIATSANGDIYVGGNPSDDTSPHILSFSATANGPSTPLSDIELPPFYVIQSLALDKAGDLYVLEWGENYYASEAIMKFAPNSTGAATPESTLPAESFDSTASTQLVVPQDIASSADGTLYVANAMPGGGNVLIFSPTSNGPSAAPAAVIGGNKTLISTPYRVAVDSSGRIYVLVADNSAMTYGYGDPPRAVNPRICIFAPNANGNVAPVAVIAGPSTGMQSPWGMRVDSEGGIFVGDFASGAISYFAPGANGNVAPTRVISGGNTGFGSSNLATVGL